MIDGQGPFDWEGESEWRRQLTLIRIVLQAQMRTGQAALNLEGETSTDESPSNKHSQEKDKTLIRKTVLAGRKSCTRVVCTYSFYCSVQRLFQHALPYTNKRSINQLSRFEAAPEPYPPVIGPSAGRRRNNKEQSKSMTDPKQPDHLFSQLSTSAKQAGSTGACV